MFKQLAFIAILSSSILHAQDTTSKRFESLNVDSKERLAIVRSENHRVNARLNNSRNLKKIEASFKKITSNYVLGKVTSDKGITYTLKDNGMGLPSELTEVSADGVSSVIFSSLSLAKNNTYNPAALTLNPSQTKAVLLFSYKGSTDGLKIVTIDLETKKVIFESSNFYFKSPEDAIFFVDDQNLVIEGEAGLVKLSILSEKISDEVILPRAEIYETGDGWLHAVDDKEDHYFLTSAGLFNLGKHQLLEVLRKYTSTIYFKEETNLDTKIMTSVKKFDLTTQSMTTFFTKELEASAIFVSSRGFVVSESIGFNKYFTLFDDDGAEVSKVAVPFFCQMTGSAYEFDNDKKITGLKLTLTGLANSVNYIWNFDEKNPVIPASLFANVMSNDDIIYVVEEKFAKSFDGVMIPYRMVYKKGLELKNQPVYMESYGGFGSSGHFANTLDVFSRDFIKHGGIYVGPGIRGGNEYGASWHTQAMKDLKYKTYEDLASIAKALIDEGISSKEKIASAGSSNGGLVVAATGLLYPQYFGLVIPHNGVLDMLGKATLDPKYDFGWSYEYGDARIEKDREYLQKYSPLELVSKVANPPRILVLNGRTDTRVNPAHSIKFAAAARAAGKDSVELVSINNSGHMNTSLKFSDFIGWRLQVVKWSTIYDLFNMDY